MDIIDLNRTSREKDEEA